MRPSGTSTSTTGLVSANGKATYRASFSRVAVFASRFSTSIQGSSSYRVTVEVSDGKPSSRRVAMRRTPIPGRSEEHTSELQSRLHLVCRLLLEKKKTQSRYKYTQEVD